VGASASPGARLPARGAEVLLAAIAEPDPEDLRHLLLLLRRQRPVEPQGAPPQIAVRDRYGEEKEIQTPAEAAVTAGGAKKGLSDLKVGDKVTVEYEFDVATGKRTAKSITVGEGTSPQ